MQSTCGKKSRFRYQYSSILFVGGQENHRFDAEMLGIMLMDVSKKFECNEPANRHDSSIMGI